MGEWSPDRGRPQGAARTTRTIGAFFIAATILVFPLAAVAIGEAESEDGDYSIEAIGSARLTGGYLRLPDVPEFFSERDEGIITSVVRLILEGDLGQYLDYEINLFSDFSRVPPAFLGGTFASAGSLESPYRYQHLSWDYSEGGEVSGKLGIDRFALNLNVKSVNISAGRMPVNYSITHIFTPNDFFAPFSATAINTMYKPGVDALRIGVATGMLSSVEVVGVMGYEYSYKVEHESPSWYQSALLARAATVLWNFEWALLGGKLAQRWVAGASIQGEAGPFGLRAEGHLGFPDRQDYGLSVDDRDDRIHGRVATGLDVLFAWHNASIGAEYMFMSDGASGPSTYGKRLSNFFPDDLRYFGQHYAGLSAGMELIPILRANVMSLLNAADLSGLCALTLIYSLADEADLVAGLMVPWGEGPKLVPMPPDAMFEMQSEYGAMPLMVFMESRFYF